MVKEQKTSPMSYIALFGIIGLGAYEIQAGKGTSYWVYGALFGIVISVNIRDIIALRKIYKGDKDK